jgi:hypothetical protein
MIQDRDLGDETPELEVLEKTTLWIVGKIVSLATPPAWEFQGVYTTRARAELACRTRNYFVGPAVLDVVINDDAVTWPGVYFPKP